MATVNLYQLPSQAAVKLSANFCVQEMACSDGSFVVLIDPNLMALLQKIRGHFGRPVTITSGYRTPAYNSKIGGSGASKHCLGMAADIKVAGVSPLEVAKYAVFIGAGGVGLYSTWTHVDTRASKYFWDKRSGTEVQVRAFTK